MYGRLVFMVCLFVWYVGFVGRLVLCGVGLYDGWVHGSLCFPTWCTLFSIKGQVYFVSGGYEPKACGKPTRALPTEL